MDEMRKLLESCWINKATDKELYHKVKRELPKFRRFIREQLGWRLIENERIIKLEKTPARAESFMGLGGFYDVRDYCILCVLLIFLEDKEDNEQFLLSELISMLEAQLSEYMEVDWTKFVQRKSLVRALQFAEKMGMLAVYDGNSDSISEGIGQEVLYENTGLSRYFATSFDYDVKDIESYMDFETKQPEEVESGRGHFRVNRVYRQLVSAPAMYWKEADDQDSIYVKNQRQWVQKSLDDHLGGQLHIHKNAAFFVMDEDDCFGERHPRDAMLPELVLLICSEIRNQVLQGRLVKENDECIRISEDQFIKLITKCKTKYGEAWSKEYREMSEEKVAEVVMEYMKSWMLLAEDFNSTSNSNYNDQTGNGFADDTGESADSGNAEDAKIIILPAAGKIIGQYPKDFKAKDGKQ